MSLSLLITINVLADIALLAGLAYVTSRPTGLKPHVASLRQSQDAQATPAPAEQRLPRSPRSSRPQVARPRASLASSAGSHTSVVHES